MFTELVISDLGDATAAGIHRLEFNFHGYGVNVFRFISVSIEKIFREIYTYWGLDHEKW